MFARVVRRLVRDLRDEHLTSERENNGRLTRYHAHVLVGLHDLLDTSQGQNLRLQSVQVIGFGLDFIVQLLELFVQFVYVFGVVGVLYMKNRESKYLGDRTKFINDFIVS